MMHKTEMFYNFNFKFNEHASDEGAMTCHPLHIHSLQFRLFKGQSLLN